MTLRLDATGPGVEPASGDPASIRLCILGPLRLWRNGVELAAGPPQQAYLLALLLAREGRPTGTEELVDLIWGEDAPATAVNVIHKYVGALRHLLEPSLRTRGEGSYILRRGTSYVCAAGPGALDLVDFRELMGSARVQLEEHRDAVALDLYVEALRLWRGPAGDGLTHNPSAAPIFAHLNDEFFDACVAATRLAVALGQPERVLPSLQLAASLALFHEPVQASLVTALGAVGQQSAALTVYSTVRTRLAEELGIDPGPALQSAHRRVLRQELTPSRGSNDTNLAPAPPISRPAMAPDSELVGRADELAVLRQAVERAHAGEAGLVLIEGEPGVGKTRLLEEIATQARTSNALVVWSYCLEGDGTPSMWPWIQIVDTILRRLDAQARSTWIRGELGRLTRPQRFDAAPVNDEASDDLSGDLVEEDSTTPAATAMPDASRQFRLFEEVVAVIAEAASQRPLVLVLDDLQWADATSLRLLGHLASRLPGGTAVLGSLRDHAPTPGAELTRLLATASRSPGHRRIQLGPLNLDSVTELIRRETGQNPDHELAHSIHTRTAGNPFFVRELTRFLIESVDPGDHAQARPSVPPTVRDVIRDRMASLDPRQSDLLQLAALMGREVDVRLLASAAAVDVRICMESIEPLEELGLLAPISGDVLAYRFVHDLIRESVVEAAPAPQSTWKHLRIAEAIDKTKADDPSAAERLAFHLRAAGPLADPARTAEMLVRAGRRAASKFAFDAADRHLEAAARVAHAAGLPETELLALSLRTIVFRQEGHGGSTLAPEGAEHLARRLGRDAYATSFLFTRLVGSYTSGAPDREALARHVHEQGMASSDPVIRAYGTQAWGLHQWDIGNIGEALRAFQVDNSRIILENPSPEDEAAVRKEVAAEWPEWFAVVTALHGDLPAARAFLATRDGATGHNPFTVSISVFYALSIAVLAGDAESALLAAERWARVDPDGMVTQRDGYIRQAHLWARALTGDDPEGATTEAEEHLAATFLGAPRWGLVVQLALVAEGWLAAGKTFEASRALDRATEVIKSYGQRYGEGLVLLLRSRLMHARGEPVADVRAAAERARARSIEHEAHLFADRAERFLTELSSDPKIPA